MVSTVLDVLGALLVAAFAFCVWPPAALLVLGVGCLLVSWQSSRGGDS